jgi:hypothetical protein
MRFFATANLRSERIAYVGEFLVKLALADDETERGLIWPRQAAAWWGVLRSAVGEWIIHDLGWIAAQSTPG